MNEKPTTEMDQMDAALKAIDSRKRAGLTLKNGPRSIMLYHNPSCQNCQIKALKAGTFTNCPGCPQEKLQDVPEVKNYSQTKRAAIDLIGPMARVWHSDDGVQIGFDMRPGRKVYGSGSTFDIALRRAVSEFRGADGKAYPGKK